MPRSEPWSRTPGTGRDQRAVRQPRTRILVVCEGAKTEPNYFVKFPAADVHDIQVKGTGYNTDTLVEYAIGERNAAEDRGTPFNEVWAVFDRDSFPAQNFNRAIQLARNQQIHVAVTNEAFELWYLLHFNFCDAGISRTTYAKRLTPLLELEYKKNLPDIYARLLEHQPRAIRHAYALLSRYSPWNPEQHNPSTSVHFLVERLNGLAE